MLFLHTKQAENCSIRLQPRFREKRTVWENGNNNVTGSPAWCVECVAMLATGDHSRLLTMYAYLLNRLPGRWSDWIGWSGVYGPVAANGLTRSGQSPRLMPSARAAFTAEPSGSTRERLPIASAIGTLLMSGG